MEHVSFKPEEKYNLTLINHKNNKWKKLTQRTANRNYKIKRRKVKISVIQNFVVA
jgi:hypothetical protein